MVPKGSQVRLTAQFLVSHDVHYPDLMATKGTNHTILHMRYPDEFYHLSTLSMVQLHSVLIFVPNLQQRL